MSLSLTRLISVYSCPCVAVLIIEKSNWLPTENNEILSLCIQSKDLEVWQLVLGNAAKI